jgi:hypothetical protein
MTTESTATMILRRAVAAARFCAGVVTVVGLAGKNSTVRKRRATGRHRRLK